MCDMDAWAEAEVERFFRKGMFLARREGCWDIVEDVGDGVVYVVVYGEEAEVEESEESAENWLDVSESCKVVSEPSCDNIGGWPADISPKYCSANRRPCSWLTPAKARIMRSG